MERIIDEKSIPHGEYCYEILSVNSSLNGTVIKTRRCPFFVFKTVDDGNDYSMGKKLFKLNFPRVRVTNKTYSCNHCVNHWGIDLCSCGSGLSPNKCKENNSDCGEPSQILGFKDFWDNTFLPALSKTEISDC